MKRLLLAIAIGAASLMVGTASASATSARETASPTPLLAYYYIWFTPSSWNRAKIDYPVVGRYSSDDTGVMRQHVRWAKAAGINGFLVSWKSTPPLNERLARLIKVADAEQFRLGIVYEGLDFARHPLPIATVRHDLEQFANTFAADPAFAIFDRPVVVWAGTWRYTNAQIRWATRNVRTKLRLLASAKQVADYERVAPLFDGSAYYWSSVNPKRYTSYGDKLRAMASAIHARKGLWIAPAAPGFDSRKLGGTSTVPRLGGATLRSELNTAAASSPDAIGVISWNEFSENTYVEPSKAYSNTELKVIADFRGARAPDSSSFDSAGTTTGQAPLGISNGIIGLAAGLVGLFAVVTIARHRRRRPPPPSLVKDPLGP